jgi:hypothetical protein
MAGQQRSFRVARSIAGVALVAVGTLNLYQNLTELLVRLRHVLAANGSEAIGVLPAVIQTVLQVSQNYATGHQRFLQVLFQQALISSWPLMLVMIGTILSREALRDNV